MTSVQRESLINAAVGSWMENFSNGPADEVVFLEPMLVGGHRGYGQMNDEELLETVKKECGYEMYCGNEDFSGETEQLGKLVAVLGEIVKGGK